MRKKKTAGIILMLMTVALAAGCIYYVSDYYHSDESVTALLGGTEKVQVVEIEEGVFLDGSGEEKAIIFYPGAKVEYTAYVPLFMELAGNGIDCFLTKMPCNLAILGINKAEDIMQKYSYDEWYLAGHSLGGAMAAAYASEHPEKLEGLVLLAAYPTKSLNADDFAVLSIYGSEDQVLNREKLEEGIQWMPEDYTELCIEGGNHAQFGSYGVQDGDGQAKITSEEQIRRTAEAVMEMMD